MSAALLVFLGGGIGSVLRWTTGLAALRLFGPDWPWGTLTVNVVGCFAMGLLFRLLGPTGVSEARLLLLTGVLGGFTTFSAFALDSALLLFRQEIGGLLWYLAGTMTLSFGGIAAGLWLGKWLSP